MERIITALPARALLVIDEAYAEYAASWPEVDHADGLASLRRDKRVVVLRTFSKIYGLAGLRIGYALGDAAVIDVLDRVSRVFSVSSLAQVGAGGARRRRARPHAAARSPGARSSGCSARSAVPACACIRRSRTSC
jgi:histidinol-phosphate aminotransferase